MKYGYALPIVCMLRRSSGRAAWPFLGKVNSATTFDSLMFIFVLSWALLGY